MRARALVTAALGLVAAAGCEVSARFDDTRFACDQGAACPDGFACRYGSCVRDEGPPACGGLGVWKDDFTAPIPWGQTVRGAGPSLASGAFVLDSSAPASIWQARNAVDGGHGELVIEWGAFEGGLGRFDGVQLAAPASRHLIAIERFQAEPGGPVVIRARAGEGMTMYDELTTQAVLVEGPDVAALRAWRLATVDGALELWAARTLDELIAQGPVATVPLPRTFDLAQVLVGFRAGKDPAEAATLRLRIDELNRPGTPVPACRPPAVLDPLTDVSVTRSRWREYTSSCPMIVGGGRLEYLGASSPRECGLDYWPVIDASATRFSIGFVPRRYWQPFVRLNGADQDTLVRIALEYDYDPADRVEITCDRPCREGSADQLVTLPLTPVAPPLVDDQPYYLGLRVDGSRLHVDVSGDGVTWVTLTDAGGVALPPPVSQGLEVGARLSWPSGTDPGVVMPQTLLPPRADRL